MFCSKQSKKILEWNSLNSRQREVFIFAFNIELNEKEVGGSLTKIMKRVIPITNKEELREIFKATCPKSNVLCVINYKFITVINLDPK